MELLTLLTHLYAGRSTGCIRKRITLTLWFQTTIVPDWNYRIIQMNAALPVNVEHDVHGRKPFHINTLNARHKA
jgi:hypothetical protein